MKSKLFKGIAAISGSLLTICSFMSVLAFDREGDINLHLGITTGTGGDVSNNTNYFPSAYKDKAEMVKAEKDYLIQSQIEGSVLLKNDSSGLPLKSSEKKVTLFGNASVNPAYHGASGGPANSGTDLKDALTEEGYSINQKVYDAIKNQNVKRGNSNIGEVSSSTYNKTDFEGYKDAAIVVICRYGGENNDMDVTDSFGVRELSLHDSEKEMLQIVKEYGFGKIIVLLNTGYAMEVDWLDDYDVDSCLWIGYPGNYGMTGVARMLSGKANPSGKLVDTYASNSLSSPAMQNFGDFKFSDLPNQIYHCEYLVYAEGIYVGYKYYESRYQDQILGINNATSNKGIFTSVSNWDYSDEVSYPFGYGLSYTTFSQQLTSVDWDHNTHKLTANVKVTNNGTVSGKSVVQLYSQLPYETGMAQKSAIQLIGFNKTQELAPNASEDISVEVSDYLFATYDENATNGVDNTKKGCYVFDPGDYYFAIGDSSHDALNNVLKARNVSSNLKDEEGNIVVGDATKTKKFNLETKDNTTYATSPTTGEVVSNQFQEVDLNYHIKNAVTYLTRDNWNTFPSAVMELKADDDTTGTIRKYMTATKSLYTTPSDAPNYKDFKYGQEVSKKFVELKDTGYEEDETWSSFTDQLDIATLTSLVGEKMAMDPIESIGFPGVTNGDGPDGLQSGGTLHVSENLACSTYNIELIKQRGQFLQEDAYYNGLRMVYGGGANLHRTPYAGRNFEYYSEDSTMSYYMGLYQAKEMSSHGLVSAFKHFCGNDQETNRHGVATFMTEQTLRQGDLRGFEGALGEGGSLGNMSAYNRLGVIPTASYKALMTQVLRTEWGFKGISITDSSKDSASYIFTADAIEAGTDQFNNDAKRSTEAKALLVTNRDGNIWSKCREICKHVMYSYSRSMAVNGLSVDTVVKNVKPWWKTAIYAIDGSLAGITVLSIGGYVALEFIIKKKDINQVKGEKE